MSEIADDDRFAPILPGPGATDYERYLRTDELLALQKTPAEMRHRDELLFQTVHQTTELWLKLASFELETATALVRERELGSAIRLLRRAVLCLRFVTEALDMLEQMSPWDFQEVRHAVGHGSGFDSPGWKQLRGLAPDLGEEFQRLLRERGLDLVSLYQRGGEHEDVHQLAELLIELDERCVLWRHRHFFVVKRLIGDDVIGTQGTPVQLLIPLLDKTFFPELWRARGRLTELAWPEEYGESEP